MSLERPQMPMLPKGYEVIEGEAVRRRNFLVAKLLSEYAKTMLGPLGMYKMLVEAQGDVIVTKDGKVMMDKIEAVHPIAIMLKKAIEAQDIEVGDGTKTTLVLTGALLEEAEKLIEQKIHPTTIIRGYSQALKIASDALDKIKSKVTMDNEELVKAVIRTVIAGRFDKNSREHLTSIILGTVNQVFDHKNQKLNVNYIDCRKKEGGSIRDSELIQGLIIYKERPHPNMPRRIKTANIVLITRSLELTRKTNEAMKEYLVEDPSQLRSFKKAEIDYMKEIARKVKEAGADIVFCEKRISDLMMDIFAETGILAFSMTGKEGMEKLAKAVGARPISAVNQIKPADCGWVNLAEFKRIAGEEMLFLLGPHDPKAVSILIRGGTKQIINEVERIIIDAAKTVSATIRGGGIVPGGGAAELEMALAIRNSLKSIKGKEQLAYVNLANAVESIPEALIANSGLDITDYLVKLRSEHAKGSINTGLNVLNHKIIDMKRAGIVEAYNVKKYALNLAFEVAISILRIDGMIAVTKPAEIEREEARMVKERERIQQMKTKRALEKDEELKMVERRLMERMDHQ